MSPFSANQHTLKGNNITILKIKTLLRIFIKLELPLELQYFEFACHHFSFKKEIFYGQLVQRNRKFWVMIFDKPAHTKPAHTKTMCLI